jgi:membrane fusion protein (multidrug efflux system)
LAGTLKANQESELAANASGRVTRTMVERGTYVRSGQAIAQLDTRISALSTSEAEANVETARTQKAQADGECARYEKLFERGIITQQEFQRQTTACKTSSSSTAAAETHVQLMKQTLADGTIKAPFPGLVSERYVSVGEYVMPASRVAHIVDIDPLRLELTIPEQNMGAVKKGQIVDFQVGAFPNQTFRGTVQFIGPAVRAATRDLVFEAVVPNKDKLLRPGLFATSTLSVGVQKLPVVPETALRRDGENVRLFAVANKRIEERVVQVGPSADKLVAILKGAAEGEQVVNNPGPQISDGAEVE